MVAKNGRTDPDSIRQCSYMIAKKEFRPKPLELRASTPKLRYDPNLTAYDGLTREYMEGLQFLPQKENLIFLGSVGPGKTHLATAIALKACQAGRRVRFFTAASLANLLLERNNKGTQNSFLENLRSSLWTRSALFHPIRRPPSCCSRSSQTVMSAGASSLPPTWSSASGTPSLAATASPSP